MTAGVLFIMIFPLFSEAPKASAASSGIVVATVQVMPPTQAAADTDFSLDLTVGLMVVIREVALIFVSLPVASLAIFSARMSLINAVKINQVKYIG